MTIQCQSAEKKFDNHAPRPNISAKLGGLLQIKWYRWIVRGVGPNPMNSKALYIES